MSSLAPEIDPRAKENQCSDDQLCPRTGFKVARSEQGPLCSVLSHRHG